MIRLAVFDVDGTLFSHKSMQVPRSAVNAIQDLQSQGILVVIASGRPAHVMRHITEAGIQPDYVVGCNGHCVYKGMQELMGGFYFTKQMVGDLTDFCVKYDYPLTWKFPFKNCVYNGFEQLREVHERLKVAKDAVCECYERNYHETELPFGGVVYAPQDVVDVYAKEHPELVFLPFAVDRYDVSLANVNKATGLKLLLDELSMTFDECIAFGDALNDIEMIREAGIGVAMKECVDELLDVCDYQTEDCLDDGIAKALLYYQLIDEIKCK